MQKETHAQKSGQKQPAAKTRIARFLLPSVDANSALLPSDRWIMSTAREIYSTHVPLRRDLARGGWFAAGAAALTVVAVASVTAGATLFSPLLAVAMAGGALAGAAACGYASKKALLSLRQKTLPSLREELMARYVKMKGADLAEEWARRAEARRRERAKAAPVQKPENLTPSAEVKPEKLDTPSGATRKLGAWALKTALEKAQKSKKTPNPDPLANKGPRCDDKTPDSPKKY